MNVSKIEVSVGQFKFVGEGDSKWLADQLDKILKEAAKMANLFPDQVERKTASTISNSKDGGLSVSLAKMLKDKNVTTNQTQKFLGSAIFLSLKGKTNLKTSDVTNALRDAGQTRLSNASECLNANVKKGFLEKLSGNEFMVTVHGKESFGINE